nr:hypothetical protein [uncultured Undibacterium sp.]
MQASVHAQTMYRCGSNYQDKPCANGQTGKVIGTQRATPTEAETKNTVDSVCAKRSEDAKKIIWMRQGGAAKEDVMAKADSAAQQRLVDEVYATRGDTPQIRASIEKRCMESRTLQRSPESMSDAELLSAAKALEKRINNAEKAEASRVAPVEQEAPAPKRKLPCQNIKMQMEIVNNTIRAGADVQTLQQLNQQKRDLEKDWTAGSCR